MPHPDPFRSPLRFRPVYKDYIWGGRRLADAFGRELPEGRCAESWEVSDRPEGMSVVEEGPAAGRTLRELIEQNATDLLGTAAAGSSRFPLLVKLIDARERLSLQVHPDDLSAPRLGGEPKTEMWYALADGPMRVLCGLRPGVSRAAFSAALERGAPEPLLREIFLRRGEAVFVPGGRLHAIDGGGLLLEIQQNSNTIYRVWDWGRVGADGKPRPLHVEQALEAIDWADGTDPRLTPRPLGRGPGFREEEIARTPFFVLERLVLEDGEVAADTAGRSFHLLFAASGTPRLRWRGGEEALPFGRTTLLPAALGAYTLAGRGEILRVRLP